MYVECTQYNEWVYWFEKLLFRAVRGWKHFNSKALALWRHFLKACILFQHLEDNSLENKCILWQNCPHTPTLCIFKPFFGHPHTTSVQQHAFVYKCYCRCFFGSFLCWESRQLLCPNGMRIVWHSFDMCIRHMATIVKNCKLYNTYLGVEKHQNTTYSIYTPPLRKANWFVLHK